MSLPRTIETLTVLGDESRLRLCALLRERELCVTDLVRVTGISQSRVSTHLGRLRDAGFVRDRRQGAQSFYALAADALPGTAQAVLDEAAGSTDPTLVGDRQRLEELDRERREGQPESITDERERDYAPGRTWQSLAVGMAALLRLGDVLDIGSGDGAAANVIAPYCRSLTCLDRSARLVEAARDRLTRHEHVRTLVADAHRLPFDDARFDAVLIFHTLTYAERPQKVLEEAARVLRPNGRLVVLCLDEHTQHEVTARYGERHPGFSPRTLRAMLGRAGFDLLSCDLASREPKKPHLGVLVAVADRATRVAVLPRERSSPGRPSSSSSPSSSSPSPQPSPQRKKRLRAA